MLERVDKNILLGIAENLSELGKDFLIQAKKDFINERKKEMQASDSEFFCKEWICAVKSKSYDLSLELEKAVFYSIKCEWTENAECFFNYDDPSVKLIDKSISMELCYG